MKGTSKRPWWGFRGAVGGLEGSLLREKEGSEGPLRVPAEAVKA